MNTQRHLGPLAITAILFNMSDASVVGAFIALLPVYFTIPFGDSSNVACADGSCTYGSITNDYLFTIDTSESPIGSGGFITITFNFDLNCDSEAAKNYGITNTGGEGLDQSVNLYCD